MANDKPISGELAALLPAMAQTMKFSLQAIQQSMALSSLLIAKGVLTQEELNQSVAANAQATKTLQDALVGLDKKPD